MPEETTGAEAQEIQVPLPQINTDSRFVLRVVWLEKNIAIAVDYVVNKGLSPLTRYYFWPRTDAWQELKDELDKKSWITEEEKIELLNQATEIINFWQEHAKDTTMFQAQEKFPHIVFAGTD